MNNDFMNEGNGGLGSLIKQSIPKAMPTILAVVIGGLFYLVGQLAVAWYPAQPLQEINMNGTGTVKLAPTVARFTATVETTSPSSTSEAAQTFVQTQFDRITNTLETLGLSENDLRTTDFSVTTDYAYGPTGGSTFRGYSGRGSLEVSLNDPSRLQEVVTAVGKAGGQVSGVTFDLEDQDNARREAFKKAVDNARISAEETAQSLGRRLGKVTRIGTPIIADQPYYDSGGFAGALSLPGGTQEIKVSAEVTYQLK